MSSYSAVRMGWSTTAVIRRHDPAGTAITTLTLGTGSVHAVEDGRYVAVCGAEVVWPFHGERPHWPPRSSYACRDCVRLLKEREAAAAPQPDIGSPRVEHAG